MRTVAYSDYLNDVTALMGLTTSDLSSIETTQLNSFFNKAVRRIWETNNWPDLCPYGEVRFPTNLITYPNDLTQTSYSITNGTVTAAAINNPLDNRVTASKLMETTATGLHGFSQTITCLPGQNYYASGYVRPNGENYIQVVANDGVTSYSSFFSLLTPGSSGTTSGLNVTNGIQQQANGFYYWNIAFTASSSASTGSVAVYLSPDGVTTSYAGSTSKGAYFWGNTMSAPTTNPPAQYVVPWEQIGENAIDVLFDAWNTNPGAFLPPYRVMYQATTSGLQIIGPSNVGPIYTWYRQRRPNFTGSTWNSSSTYTLGNQVYFTSSSTSSSNYYSVLTSTSAGQSPDTNPSSFSVLNIPYIFHEYIRHSAYADWLEIEGQFLKAQAMRAYAQSFIDDETDRMERQQGQIMPWKVYTHVTSQNRGLGYLGQNFNVGTATIN